MADPSTSPPLTRDSVVAARELIAPYIHHTPTVTNATLTALASAGLELDDEEDKAGASRPPRLRLYFKCENLQRVGAFKARGAFHALERLKREPGWREAGGMEKGVVTHSSGEWAGVYLFFIHFFFFLVGALGERGAGDGGLWYRDGG